MSNICERDARYPILVNVPSQAVSTQLVCLGPQVVDGKTSYRYGFSDFNLIDALVREGGILGIAFSQKSGRFQVMRFDNNGAAARLDEMIRKSLERDRTSTKGQVL